MKILLVTGKLAEKDVREVAGGIAEVLVLDVEVASFITPKLLERALERRGEKWDLVLIPGYCSGDFSYLEKKFGFPVRKGPKSALDIPLVLENLDSIELSSERPADEVLVELKLKSVRKELEEAEKSARFSFELSGVKIGGDSRMKILAEIVSADRMSERELEERVEYYASSGADIIDLGISLDASSEDVRRVTKFVSSIFSPISVDTLSPRLIEAALPHVDLVLSLDESNMENVGKRLSSYETAAVILPGKRGLQENVQRAQDLGIEKIIADPVLHPPNLGFMRSLLNYFEFHSSNPEIPLLFGAGNVSELIDADSPGVHAILAVLAHEVGASILFTPESSPKCRNAVRELRVASEMVKIASKRNSPPKDLGIDLLILKEKRRYEENFDVREPVIEAEEREEWTPDPRGSYRIAVKDGEIYLIGERFTIKGRSAKAILDRLIEIGGVSLLEHVSYLARELTKAELSLKFGRSYIQDTYSI
ncbi:MAG: hypothetical protein PWR13_408 [Archaeoglobi archaeon]|nr:hypothetical protein [Archaeoglobi archaeon]MDK2781380.1 hypothetical protein [Archaeoglobi archaeon]